MTNWAWSKVLSNICYFLETWLVEFSNSLLVWLFSLKETETRWRERSEDRAPHVFRGLQRSLISIMLKTRHVGFTVLDVRFDHQLLSRPLVSLVQNPRDELSCLKGSVFVFNHLHRRRLVLSWSSSERFPAVNTSRNSPSKKNARLWSSDPLTVSVSEIRALWPTWPWRRGPAWTSSSAPACWEIWVEPGGGLLASSRRFLLPELGSPGGREGRTKLNTSGCQRDLWFVTTNRECPINDLRILKLHQMIILFLFYVLQQHSLISSKPLTSNRNLLL